MALASAYRVPKTRQLHSTNSAEHDLERNSFTLYYYLELESETQLLRNRACHVYRVIPQAPPNHNAFSICFPQYSSLQYAHPRSTALLPSTMLCTSWLNRPLPVSCSTARDIYACARSGFRVRTPLVISGGRDHLPGVQGV